jgi:hypothetical protein
MVHHRLLPQFSAEFQKMRRKPSMSHYRSPIEKITMNALTISSHRLLKQIGRALAAFSLLTLMVTPLAAQTFRGTILGTVLDPNGAVVLGARVTAKNINTGIERTTETDDQGNYTIAELQTGSYEVTIRQPGFQTAIVTNVIVGVSAERRVDVSLVVAGADTVVQVAAAAQVETTSNTLGGTITQKVV